MLPFYYWVYTLMTYTYAQEDFCNIHCRAVFKQGWGVQPKSPPLRDTWLNYKMYTIKYYTETTTNYSYILTMINLKDQ